MNKQYVEVYYWDRTRPIAVSAEVAEAAYLAMERACRDMRIGPLFVRFFRSDAEVFHLTGGAGLEHWDWSRRVKFSAGEVIGRVDRAAAPYDILVSASLSPRKAAHTSAHECFHQAVGRRASMLGRNEEAPAQRYEYEHCRKYLGGPCGDCKQNVPRISKVLAQAVQSSRPYGYEIT